jgi:uroporphyrinogen-III synthase
VALVVLTREPPRNDPLAADLRGLAEVAEVPLTSTAYRSEQAVAHELASIAREPAACVVVTSARAARFAGLALSAARADAPVVVVGDQSASAVRSVVGQAHRVIVAPGRSATSVARCVEGGPALALSAARPRHELDDELAHRGIALLRVTCYETVTARLDIEQRELLAEADVVVVGAPSAWEVARGVIARGATVVALGATTTRAVAQDHDHVVDGGADALGAIARALDSRQERRGGPPLG